MELNQYYSMKTFLKRLTALFLSIISCFVLIYLTLYFISIIIQLFKF